MARPALHIALLALLIGSCATSPDATTTQAPRELFRPFTGTTLAGDSFDSRQVVAGHVAVVNFVASWCGPCKRELPHLERLYQKYKDRGLVVVAVSDEPHKQEALAALIQATGARFPVVLVPPGAPVTRHNPSGEFPVSMLIARDGTIAARFEGYRTGDEITLERAILRELGAE